MIEKNEIGYRVTVPMLIANARTLLESGRDFMRADPAMEMLLDLGPVQDVDSSALAVLFGLQRTAHARGTGFRIANPPGSLISLAGLYGVSDSLPLA